MLELIRDLRALGAEEISLSPEGKVVNVKFGHSVMLPPSTPEAEHEAKRITMPTPDQARYDWYKRVAGAGE